MVKKNFEISSRIGHFIGYFRLSRPSEQGKKKYHFQKSSYFNVVFMEKNNFEIFSRNDHFIGYFGLFQASQAKRAGCENISVFRKNS